MLLYSLLTLRHPQERWRLIPLDHLHLQLDLNLHLGSLKLGNRGYCKRMWLRPLNAPRLPETSGQKSQFVEEDSGAPAHLQGRSYKTWKRLKRLQLSEICPWCNCSRILVVASISSARRRARLLQTSGEDRVLQETQVGGPQGVRNCFFRGDSMVMQMDDNQHKQQVWVDDVFTQTGLSFQEEEGRRQGVQRVELKLTPLPLGMLITPICSRSH